MSVAPTRASSWLGPVHELKAAGVLIKWTEHISFATNEQKDSWFLAINPNGRIPTVVDNDAKASQCGSGSILLYLARYYDKTFILHFEDEDEETEIVNWIFFAQGGLGPMMGQAGHFVSAAPEKIPYAAGRFITESKRLRVYEDRLASRDFLVGAGRGKYSYAGIVTVTWARASHFSLGVPHLSEAGFPRVQKWIEGIEARPAGKIVFTTDFITSGRQGEGWEEVARKKVEWVWKN